MGVPVTWGRGSVLSVSKEGVEAVGLVTTGPGVASRVGSRIHRSLACRAVREAPSRNGQCQAAGRAPTVLTSMRVWKYPRRSPRKQLREEHRPQWEGVFHQSEDGVCVDASVPELDPHVRLGLLALLAPRGDGAAFDEGLWRPTWALARGSKRQLAAVSACFSDSANGLCWGKNGRLRAWKQSFAFTLRKSRYREVAIYLKVKVWHVEIWGSLKFNIPKLGMSIWHMESHFPFSKFSPVNKFKVK